MSLTTLYQIVTFENVAISGAATLPHGISVNGAAQIPDFIARDAQEFEILDVTATEITVVNRGRQEATCNVWVALLHTIDRAFGGPIALTPRPFIVGGAFALPTEYSLWALPNSTEYALPGDGALDDETFDDQITGYQVFYITNDGDFTASLTGMDASAKSDGAMITLFYQNNGGFDLTIKSNDTGSAAANRFALPGDVDFVLTGTNAQATFRYNSMLERWTLFASS